MCLSSSPEKSGAEPCLRCECGCFNMSCHCLHQTEARDFGLWRTSPLKDVKVRVWKEQFPGKEVCNTSMKPDRNPAAWKITLEVRTFPTNSPSSSGARLHHVMMHAAKIPVLVTELMVGSRTEELCHFGPRNCTGLSSLLRGKSATISKGSSPHFSPCTVLNVQTSLGFTVSFLQMQYSHTSIFLHLKNRSWEVKEKKLIFCGNKTMPLVPEYIANRLLEDILFFTGSSEHLILKLSRDWSRSKLHSTFFGMCLMQWVHYASSRGIFLLTTAAY